jgi:large subunit ribosomal protein L22
VRIQGDNLKRKAKAAGVSIEELSQAIERTGLDGKRAESAVRSWMRGSDHPRCKTEDVRAIASAIGCRVTEIARFESKVRHHRGSPRKARLLADLIRGKDVLSAENMLTFTTKRAAVNIRKALAAAVADAQEQGAREETLYVALCTVDAGPTIKRFQPKDRGRAHPIMKRTSHITIGVRERATREGR